MENEHESQARELKPNGIDLKIPPLILASSSPRRAEILRSVGWDFTTFPADIDESLTQGEGAVDYVERLARQKAEAAANQLDSGLVLGADTTVVVDGDVLAKPIDADEARFMLRRLSGRWHEVLTGVALICAGEFQEQKVAHESTHVQFALMSEDQINWYVATGEPMGKAGAYAIQGGAALFIDKIEGDYWNVVGLPMRLVYRMACHFVGVSLRGHPI